MKALIIQHTLGLLASVQNVKRERVAPSPRACQLQMGCRTRRRENRWLAKEGNAAVARFRIERPFGLRASAQAKRRCVEEKRFIQVYDGEPLGW